jgi:membrane protease YdiL (CAAX protease family)
MVAALWRLITWQRVPALGLRLRRPGLEAALLLGYATVYVGFSWPILGATSFTYDAFYVLGLKLTALLLVPLLGFRLLGYRLRAIVPDGLAGADGAHMPERAHWGLRARDWLAAALALGAGALLNARHFGPILAAAHGFTLPALMGRVALGLAIPLFTAALPEEIVYRGLLQTRLEAVAGRMVAVVGTALLFTAWHLPSRFLLASGVEGRAGDFVSVVMGTGLPVFVVGLVFGLLYDRYRRLVPLLAAHWGIDAVVGVANMLRLPI